MRSGTHFTQQNVLLLFTIVVTKHVLAVFSVPFPQNKFRTCFFLLGRCSEACPYKHIARPVADAKAKSVKEALELGLKAMATKTPA